MKRLNISDSDVMEIALQNEILRSEDARYDHRLHGVLLVCRGFTSYEVAEMFGQNPTTIQRWVRSFQRSGFAGLEDCEKAGRPNRLTSQQLKSINSVLRKSPRDFGYSQNMWDGKLLSHHVEELHKVPFGNDNRKLTICDNRILTTLEQSLSFEMTRGNHLTSSL